MIRSTTLTLLTIVSLWIAYSALPANGKVVTPNPGSTWLQATTTTTATPAAQPSSSLLEELDRQEHLIERQKAQINILRRQVEELTRRLNAATRT